MLKDLGDAAGARPLFERALRINETTFGPVHPTTSSIRGNLERLRKILEES